jgi:hypothetical protein
MKTPRLTFRENAAGVGCLLAVVLACVGGCLATVVARPWFFRAVEVTDHGTELLRIPSAEPSTGDPDHDGYSIRVFEDFYGHGKTCVGLMTWRAGRWGRGRGSETYKDWRILDKHTSCEWPELGDGWVAPRVVFPLGDATGQHAFFGVLPESAARVRITWADGTSRETPARTAPGR